MFYFQFCCLYLLTYGQNRKSRCTSGRRQKPHWTVGTALQPLQQLLQPGTQQLFPPNLTLEGMDPSTQLPEQLFSFHCRPFFSLPCLTPCAGKYQGMSRAAWQNCCHATLSDLSFWAGVRQKQINKKKFIKKILLPAALARTQEISQKSVFEKGNLFPAVSYITFRKTPMKFGIIVLYFLVILAL